METTNRHSWGPQINKDKYSFENVCKVCGCKRNTYPRIKSVTYERSKINFGHERPDCVDMARENQKTID